MPLGAPSALRSFLKSQASGGLVLMAAAALALLVANSPLAPAYFDALQTYLGPLSLSHWINDGLMAVFFLLVGLEIKREVLDGQLSSWNRRILPGVAALGGMIVPALIFLAFNGHDPSTARGWAIPSATDIAFALGVLSLLGNRIPTSLKVFLTALAIIDDLGAVIIIALFYTSNLSILYLALAGVILAALIGMNRCGVVRLAPYLLSGGLLWFLVLQSGVHATIAGVVLALTIPLRRAPGRPDDMKHSPLHKLEHSLHGWVTFLIVPIFGFANAGVSFAGLTPAVLTDHLTLGVALGLLVGKLVGVFGSAYLVIRADWADMPADASTVQLLGVSLLCGIGFTMSLFIGLLAFANNALLQEEVKIGILLGSALAGLLGWSILRVARRETSSTSKVQEADHA
ncbi:MULTISPECIES: Na+/H+ antiporter NhaA [Sphingomonas]|jgi:NhaA family Na+:H+ antiporter|uniref:Na(+)/H(+) antiporter NhaA n=1 Tax=Sphingomonas turrisvirgatae TaxID=1888892 RepID=A0A1E3LYQ1_9SPHN|nr:Na+/H+ antiporter NhaA [Sphingomonas turrisvirgatae]ODP38926.1 Na(+)/H(+) antiporter NhaA [Sphingomonas turrisvirgatae]